MLGSGDVADGAVACVQWSFAQEPSLLLQVCLYIEKLPLDVFV